MLLKELIGKTITDIFEISKCEHRGLDKSECFVELDNTTIIGIPYSFATSEDEVSVKKLDENAITIFKNLDELHPIYHINKEEKSIPEIANKHAEKKPTLFEKAKHLISRKKTIIKTKYIKEYDSYKVEYIENKLKHIKGRAIKDLITFGGDDEKYFFELDNGYFITETNFSPNGTGQIGINQYENLADIISWKGNDFKRLSNST